MPKRTSVLSIALASVGSFPMGEDITAFATACRS
jgi:hypothetical protein